MNVNLDGPVLDSEWVAVIESPFGFYTKTASNPNVLYRPWLEANVGKQNEDWKWEVSSVTRNMVAVYFKDEKLATIFALLYGPSYSPF